MKKKKILDNTSTSAQISTAFTVTVFAIAASVTLFGIFAFIRMFFAQGVEILLLMNYAGLLIFSVPVLMVTWDKVKKLPTKTETLPQKQLSKNAILHGILWFFTMGISTASFIILLPAGLLFIFALLNFYPAGMLSCLLIMGVCALIILGSNFTYRYFEKKLTQTQGLEHGRK